MTSHTRRRAANDTAVNKCGAKPGICSTPADAAQEDVRVLLGECRNRASLPVTEAPVWLMTSPPSRGSKERLSDYRFEARKGRTLAPQDCQISLGSHLTADL